LFLKLSFTLLTSTISLMLYDFEGRICCRIQPEEVTQTVLIEKATIVELAAASGGVSPDDMEPIRPPTVATVIVTIMVTINTRME
jgi:hypothetical protein